MASIAPLVAVTPPEELLRDLLDVSLTGVILYTPLYDPTGELVDFAFSYLNPAAQRMMSMPEQPTVTHKEQWPHSQEHGTFAFHVDAYVSGEPREYNINYQADGYDNYYRLAARRSGAGLLVSFTDTADQPRTALETALREAQIHSEQQRAQVAQALQADLLVAAQLQVRERQAFYNVFEQTPAVVALLRSPGHRYEYVNPAYQAFFPGRQLVGLDLAVAVPELVTQGFKVLIDLVYETGETYFGTELPFTPSPAVGQPVRTSYFNFTYQAYREAGEIAGISILAYEVTEQVLARQAQEAERQRLLHLFHQAPAGICILAGPDLVFEFVNPAYQRLLPDHALQDRPLIEVLPEIVGTPVEALLRGVYTKGQTHVEQGLLVPLARATDGVLEDRYFTFIYQPRRNERNAVNGILAFVFEVTEQVCTRQQAQGLAVELSTANEQLTRTNVDLDNFIYTASHDLKAPITNIEGLLISLREEMPPQPAESLVSAILDMMQDAVNRFTHTITLLTDVSKLQQEYSQEASAVALSPVIEGVRLDLLPLLQQVGGQLQVDVQATPLVTFPEKNLRSVMYNLLSNALKYHDPSRTPEVRVTSRVEDPYVVVAVQDNGLGLDLTREHQLFMMFRRMHTHVEGSGIGLYMVKKMVENVGGKIEVESYVGVGTTFTVYLPR